MIIDYARKLCFFLFSKTTLVVGNVLPLKSIHEGGVTGNVM